MLHGVGDALGKNGGGAYFWELDRSVTCFEGHHRVEAAIAFACLTVGFGVLRLLAVDGRVGPCIRFLNFLLR